MLYWIANVIVIRLQFRKRKINKCTDFDLKDWNWPLDNYENMFIHEYIITPKLAIAMKYLPFFFVDILILSTLIWF